MNRSIRKLNECTRLKSLLALSVCAIFVALQFMLQGAISLMVPELQHAFNVDMAGIGLLSSSFFYPYVFMQIPMGRFVSRYGVRRVIFYSACLLAVGCLISQAATGFYQALTGRMLMGGASAAGVVSTLEVISLLFTVRWFGLLAGVLDVVSMIGAVAGEWFIPWEMAHTGWEGVFLLSSMMALCIAIVAWVILPCRSEGQDVCSSDNQSHSIILIVLQDKRIWDVSIFGGLIFALVNSFAAMWAIPYFTAVFGDSASVTDIVSMVFIGVAIGSPIVGYLSGGRNQAKPLMIVCSITCCLFFLCIMYYPFSEVLVGLSLLSMGMACGAYVIPFVLVKKWVEPANVSAAMGMVNMIEVLIGTVIFQPFIGLLLEYSGGEVTVASYRISFNVLLVGLVFSVIGAFCGEE